MRIRNLFVLGLLVSAFGAQAQVFTKNQTLLAGSAPVVISNNYDAQSQLTTTIPIGMPVHIVYGIQVTSSNADPNPVSVAIALPPTFTQTSIRCVRFPGGSATGIPSTGGCSTPTLAIGVLAGADDKVIVAIDGYFTQAGPFTVNFVASRTGVTEPTSLNMDANIQQLPADLEIVKLVKPKGSTAAFAATTSIPFGGDVTYQVTVRNASAIDPVNHTTDLYAGPLLAVHDTISTPAPNDVSINVAATAATCQAAGNAVCPNSPGSATKGLGGNSNTQLFRVGYPTTSTGFLPAGGSFTFTFDAKITPVQLCSPGQNNKLSNRAAITYSNSTNTISDTVAANNSSTATVTLTGLPVTGCTTGGGTTAPSLPVTKALDVSTPPVWGSPLKYQISVMNNTNQTLSNLKLDDFVSGSGTPPFTATFGAGSVVCTPACVAPFPSNSSLYVTTSNLSGAQLFAVHFAPLAPGKTQTVQYEVRYDTPCSTTGTGGTITNFARLSGPASGSASVASTMPARPKCDIEVTKKQTNGPVKFSTFPVTLDYQVVFRNNSPNQAVTVGTIVDAIAYENAVYATNIPIDYSYSCSAINLTLPVGSVANKSNVAAQIQFNNPVHTGVRIFDFSSSPGVVFNPLATLTCNVSVTLKQPPLDDSKCPSKDPKNVVNTALMDLYPHNYANPGYTAPVATPLPGCVSILVGKTVSPNVVAGGPVTFTLTVKNIGNDPVSNITLTDNVPPDFTNVSWACAAGCTTTGGSAGNNISAGLTPLGPGMTTTIVVTAIAPSKLGTYCNIDNATFAPFPADTFFEGNQAALTTASACVQVKSPPPPGKPTLTKKFQQQAIAANNSTLLTFTITNASGNPSQAGISFSDTLGPGLTFGTVVANGCGGTISTSQNKSTLTFTGGALPAGTNSCTMTVKVQAANICGVHQNTPSNFSEVTNLDVSGAKAQLEVLECPSGLIVQKKVEGAPAGFSGQFPFLVQCATPAGLYQKEVTVAFPTPGFVTLSDVPPGSQCTVTEGTLPATPDGYNWTGLPVITEENGHFTVINRMTPCNETGQVRITKIVEGLPKDYQGTFKGTLQCWAGGKLTTFLVTLTAPGGLVATVTGIPLGSSCTFQETSQGPLPAGLQWNPPVYSPKYGTVLLSGQCCQDITVTNKARQCCEQPKHEK